MGNRISACTDVNFSDSVMPMAHLQFYPLQSVNDNVARFDLRWKVRFHFKRAACLARNLA
jgi:hypothetical protein